MVSYGDAPYHYVPVSMINATEPFDIKIPLQSNDKNDVDHRSDSKYLDLMSIRFRMDFCSAVNNITGRYPWWLDSGKATSITSAKALLSCPYVINGVSRNKYVICLFSNRYI